jgi:hypothetical protein
LPVIVTGVSVLVALSARTGDPFAATLATNPPNTAAKVVLIFSESTLQGNTEKWKD